MKTLHIAPGQSGGASLLQAVRDAGRDEPVLRYCDDLSCGPIDSNAPSARAGWWKSFSNYSEVEGLIEEFWKAVAATDHRLVLWFGRHSASELAFALAFADRLGSRQYDVVDVTGVQWQLTRPDGSIATAPPAPAMSIIPSVQLMPLFGRARPISPDERAQSSLRWRKLQEENAYFRIVTSAGLVSASENYFDSMLLRRASAEWRKTASIVGDVLGDCYEPYYQVGDLMLLARVVALVGQGKLLAGGDPWDLQESRVRLPEKAATN